MIHPEGVLELRRVIFMLMLVLLLVMGVVPALAEDCNCNYNCPLVNVNGQCVGECSVPQVYVPPVGTGPVPSYVPTYLWNF